jgi:hypothetical protein
MEESGHQHSLATLQPGTEPLVPIGYGADCASIPVWMLWRTEKFLPLPGIEHWSSSALAVAIPTELSLLPYPGFYLKLVRNRFLPYPFHFISR